MKKFLFNVFIIALFSIKLIAQDEKLDDLPFTDEPLKEEKSSYFVLGGGVSGTLLFNNVDNINNMLKTSGYPEITSPLFALGGQGITGLPWVPNLRVGISGMGGIKTTSNSKADTSSNYQFSSLGLSLGYGFIFTKGLAIVPEVSISSAGVVIERYYTSGNTNFETIGNAKSGLSKLTNSFINLQPQLNIEWATTNFLMLRVAVGYNYQLSSDWKLNYQTAVSNVPDGFKVSNMYAQIGVFLGLFNY
jgi:hypothetical protein